MSARLWVGMGLLLVSGCQRSPREGQHAVVAAPAAAAGDGGTLVAETRAAQPADAGDPPDAAPARGVPGSAQRFLEAVTRGRRSLSDAADPRRGALIVSFRASLIDNVCNGRPARSVATLCGEALSAKLRGLDETLRRFAPTSCSGGAQPSCVVDTRDDFAECAPVITLDFVRVAGVLQLRDVVFISREARSALPSEGA